MDVCTRQSQYCSREICRFVIFYTLRLQLPSPWEPSRKKKWEKRGTESWSGYDTRQESEDEGEQT